MIVGKFDLRPLLKGAFDAGAEAVPVGLGIYLVFRDTAELHDFLASRARRFIDWESLSRRLGILKALRAKRDPYDTHRELLDDFWESVLG